MDGRGNNCFSMTPYAQAYDCGSLLQIQALQYWPSVLNKIRKEAHPFIISHIITANKEEMHLTNLMPYLKQNIRVPSSTCTFFFWSTNCQIQNFKKNIWNRWTLTAKVTLLFIFLNCWVHSLTTLLCCHL